MNMRPFEWIFKLKTSIFHFCSFPIVIPIVNNGAGRDWWAKKKNHFRGIFLFIIQNNNN